MHPRGEVTFEANGQVWRMRFGINALADMEERTGLSVNEVFAALDGNAVRVSMLRTVVQAGLSRHHGDLTTVQVGDLIDEIGLVKMAELLGEAVKGAFPDAVGEAKAGS